MQMKFACRDHLADAVQHVRRRRRENEFGSFRVGAVEESEAGRAASRRTTESGHLEFVALEPRKSRHYFRLQRVPSSAWPLKGP